MNRDSDFCYVCNRCNRCCHGKRIPITPYDIIRIAGNQQLPTGEFIQQYTDEGVRLKVLEDVPSKPCIFLGQEGCTIHADRPAPCRIYPLGWTTLPDGEDTFYHLTPHRDSAGVYGTKGKVSDYIEAQGLGPYERTSVLYLSLYQAVAACISTSDEIVPVITSENDSVHVLDVDAFLQEQGEPPRSESESAEETAVRHVWAMYRWLETLEPKELDVE